MVVMVGMTGFEPATSASRTQRSTKLSHIPLLRLAGAIVPHFLQKKRGHANALHKYECRFVTYPKQCLPANTAPAWQNAV